MFILNFIGGLLKGWVLKILTIVSSVLTMWGLKTVLRTAPDRAGEMMKKIIETYFDPQSPWAPIVAEYVNTMTGGKLKGEQILGKSIGAFTEGATRAFVDEFFTDMLTLIMPSPEESKKNPLAGAQRYLGANLKFQMDAWYLHVIGDMQSLGMFKSLKDLPNAISWSMGLGWLSWLVMGVPFRMGTTTQMERFFNRVYTPEVITPAQLAEALDREIITRSEYYDKMLSLGWDPNEAFKLLIVRQKTLSKAELRDLYEQGIIGRDEIELELKAIGYSPALIQTLTSSIQNAKTINLKEDIVKAAIDLYEVGELLERELREYLESAGWKPTDIKLQIHASDLTRDKKGKLTNADLANAVEKNLMAWAEGRGKLQRRGFDKSEAEIYLKLRIPEDKWFG